MDRIIRFGISEASTVNRLVTSNNKPNSECSEGKYLGLIKINNKSYVVTLALQGENKGHVMVNEVLFDCYSDGDITFYYNSNKSRNCRRLEEKFNEPTILQLIKDKGEDIRTILKRVEEVKVSPLQHAFENEFYQSEQTIYPEGFDIKKLFDEDYSHEDFETVDIETMSLIGINDEVFESLRSVLDKHLSSSFYSLARHYDDLQRQNRSLIEENERLKKALAKKDEEDFHK